ncbi:MAG: sensor histidine kinase [Nitratireductor sp.]
MSNLDLYKQSIGAANTVKSVQETLNSYKLACEHMHTHSHSMALIVPHTLHNQDGKLLFASLNMPQTLKSSNTNASEEALMQEFHLQDRLALAHEIQNCVFKNEVTKCELRVIGAGNKSARQQAALWLEANIQKIETNDANTPLVMVQYENISARKNAEQRIDSVKDEAEKASITKTRFLGNVSHELRTPLNAILGFSELLNSELARQITEDKKQEYVSLIHSSAKHLLSILNDILDATKIDSGMYEIYSELLSLENCLSSTVAIMDGQAQTRSIKIEKIGFETLPEITADERALKQIFINLLSNAIKFSKDDSVVQVTTKRGARNVEIAVKDSGIGISKENIAKLGHAFFQADSKYDRNYEGTGLGLSVVRGLVELHEGTIKFDSERDVGTTVTVSLPIHGKDGRSVPAKDEVEKIVDIPSAQNVDEENFGIIRHTA